MQGIINFKKVGKLTQAAEEIPFTPQRVYWIHTAGEARGGHAHKETQQILTCVQGSYTFTVDDGEHQRNYLLDGTKPKGIYISNEWHTMINCSDDCIILVFASAYWDERDYIHDYEQWKEWINDTNCARV